MHINALEGQLSQPCLPILALAPSMKAAPPSTNQIARKGKAQTKQSMKKQQTKKHSHSPSKKPLSTSAPRESSK